MVSNGKIVQKTKSNDQQKPQPIAITMWEFSWLERRWSGAGYEDWDYALTELNTRGYNAVRIDAFPHLVANTPKEKHTIFPVWNTQDWGSPSINCVENVGAQLIQFIRVCKKYNIKVGLSTWWRQDKNESYLKIKSPKDLAETWLKVLALIQKNNLLDVILYLDVSNEFPHPMWTPFKTDLKQWYDFEAKQWMVETIHLLKEEYPEIPHSFSFYGEIEKSFPEQLDLTSLDFLDLHIWMVNFNDGEFYKKVSYNYERFSDEGYKNLALNAEKAYRENKNYWQDGLSQQIELAAQWSKNLGKPLLTTECWGLVDYKDYPLLNWDWVKELCAFGVMEATKTGRWLAMATSNFCGPQFVGMWRDIAWHLELTDVIKQAPVDKDLFDTTFGKRLLKKESI